ncbi:hypothetical protein OIU78_021922 [Salix suchowensis]|nr:hypothetical protein OIU78_021922 [Salix suchowensis]
MGCFFTCLRPKDDRSNRSRPHVSSSDSLPSKPALEAGVSKNRLSSLFLSEEKEESLRGNIENPCLGSPQISKGLRDEAKFLKACGTLPETPIEIRKGCEKFKVSPALDKDSEPSKSHSWLPNTSIKKLQLDNQTDQPSTPVKLCEEWGKGSVSSEQTPSSCITNVHTSEDRESGNHEIVIKVQANKNDNVLVGSSSENSCQAPRKYESPENLTVSKPSPKPTPLQLLDDMQTPGTVFPANLETPANGKTRIMSQYVYSVLNPVESASQWKLLKEDDFNSLQLSGEPRESLEQSEIATPKPQREVKESSSGKDLEVEASLSSWVKPPQSTLDGDSPNIDAASSKKFSFW